MLLRWLRDRRRRRLLETPFPPAWLDYLQRNVAHYRYLSPAEQKKLRNDLRIFIAEKHWEGCGGLAMTEEIQVTIASQACLLVLAFDHNYFERVKSVLVYPRAVRLASEDELDDGLIPDRHHALMGQAVYRGPVILSWRDALLGGRDQEDGQNVVFHEFAHQLDFLDGTIDGTPLLSSRAEYQRWRDVMSAEYRQLQEDATHHRATLLDQYGTTNEGEFFAVATECFFEKPVQMAKRHPRLYELLRDYYRQDTAKRCGHCHAAE